MMLEELNKSLERFVAKERDRFGDELANCIRQLIGQGVPAHTIAEFLADAMGTDCACKCFDTADWLPYHCEFAEKCSQVVGVACWEQYLKHLHVRLGE